MKKNTSFNLFRFVSFAGLGVAFSLAGLPALADQSNCVDVQGVIDLGSGATRVKVFQVDRCQKKILSTLFDESLRVSFAESLVQGASLSSGSSGQMMLSEQVISAGEEALKSLLEKAREKTQVSRLSGIATSAFRVAGNGQQVVQKYNEQFQVEIEIISQQKEGDLSVTAARRFIAQDAKLAQAKAMLVWDIGGNSQQLSEVEGSRISSTLIEGRASSAFRQLLISRFNQDSNLKSPNPIGSKNLSAARDLARLWIGKLPKQKGKTVTIGVGQVHNAGLVNLMKAQGKYTEKQLSDAIEANINKTDAELGFSYANSALSSAILVQTMMKRMNIEEVILCPWGVAEGRILEQL